MKKEGLEPQSRYRSSPESLDRELVVGAHQGTRAEVELVDDCASIQLLSPPALVLTPSGSDIARMDDCSVYLLDR